MYLSEHFKRSEFACKCGCGYDTVDSALLAVLEDIRTHFGAPTIINSACRCSQHNSDVGGSPNSQHKYGRAADITVLGTQPSIIASYLEGKYPDMYGIGKYDTFTHIDTRTKGPARWDNRK